MNLITIKDFFTVCSTQTIVIALIIAVIKILVDKFFTSKTAKQITWYLPFVAGIGFNYLYGVIFLDTTIFDESVISAGIISGTLAYAVALIMLKIYRGEPLPKNPALAVIEGLVSDYVNVDVKEQVICVIYKHYVDYGNTQTDQAVEQITQELIGCSNGLLASEELKYLARMIIDALDELTD